MKIEVISLHLNIYTVPAYFGTLLGILTLVALLIWFKEGKSSNSQENIDKSKMIIF